MSQPIYKFGKALGVTAAGIKIQSNYAAADPFPTAAGQLSIVSDSIQDAVGGTGVSVVGITGIKLAGGVYTEVSEDVTLTGTTPVAVSGWDAAWRLFRIKGGDSGSGDKPAGTITATIGGTEVAECLSVDGQSEMAVWTNDSVRSMYVRALRGGLVKSSGTTPSVVVQICTKGIGESIRNRWVPFALSESQPTWDREIDGNGIAIAPETDVWLEVVDFAGTSADVWAGFDVYSRYDSQHI